mmetsp:Transcript_65826/g.148525  ORF Transcript_65826/g.148525 Transcript_65826/m.148525 type:complete len:372 (+) Transcript_65826:1463-2578(+)
MRRAQAAVHARPVPQASLGLPGAGLGGLEALVAEQRVELGRPQALNPERQAVAQARGGTSEWRSRESPRRDQLSFGLELKGQPAREEPSELVGGKAAPVDRDPHLGSTSAGRRVKEQALRRKLGSENLPVVAVGVLLQAVRPSRDNGHPHQAHGAGRLHHDGLVPHPRPRARQPRGRRRRAASTAAWKLLLLLLPLPAGFLLLLFLAAAAVVRALSRRLAVAARGGLVDDVDGSKVEVRLGGPRRPVDGAAALVLGQGEPHYGVPARLVHLARHPLRNNARRRNERAPRGRDRPARPWRRHRRREHPSGHPGGHPSGQPRGYPRGYPGGHPGGHPRGHRRGLSTWGACFHHSGRWGRRERSCRLLLNSGLL